jgi:hypothetical protein
MLFEYVCPYVLRMFDRVFDDFWQYVFIDFLYKNMNMLTMSIFSIQNRGTWTIATTVIVNACFSIAVVVLTVIYRVEAYLQWPNTHCHARMKSRIQKTP